MSTSGSAAHSGLQLAAARQSSNLSVADVAHQLKLSPAQVEALESGEYQRLPGAVFVRGFIRNYARLLKLDPAPLVAQAEQRLPTPAASATEAAASADIPFPSQRGFRWHKYAIAALLAIAVLVAFEFYGSWSDAPPQASLGSSAVELPRSPLPAADTPAAGAVETQAPRAADAESKPPSTQSGQAAAPAVAASNAERRAGEQRVQLAFDKESWVEIRDRNGRKIFSQLNAAGTTQSVSGLPPLSLVVGNAAGVRVTYNDRPVTLSPHIHVDVARLTLE